MKNWIDYTIYNIYSSILRHFSWALKPFQGQKRTIGQVFVMMPLDLVSMDGQLQEEPIARGIPELLKKT